MRVVIPMLLAAAAVLVACADGLGRYAPKDVRAAEASITGDDFIAHVRVLSSDAFEGRAPGTPGEDKTVEYLTAQLAASGLKPGNPDGTFVQDVPLVGITGTRSATLTAGGKRMRMKFPDDYVTVSRRFTPNVKVAGTDLVFVGYGVVAPEYDWDDYKGVDVRGKTIVMLVNDPPVPDPDDASKLDAKMFGGKAMTYYGRWTYKYEIASEKGAAAALIIHETGPAGYPYEVVSGSWGRENFDLDRVDGNAGRVPVEGWITEERARTLFRLSGHSFEALKQAALQRDFKPVPLKARGTFTVNNTVRRVKSKNVIAKLEGSDPELKDQYLVYTAHWDHLGKDPNLQGDQIFNGALDNATGTSALLELAQAFTRLPSPPRRSLLFLAVTAEEKGLLGSKWYAENPLYPLTQTVANVNMDGIEIMGRTRDVIVVGKGQSTLEDVLADQVMAQGRVLVAELQPEKGSYYRSDHFEFAKVGVPALYQHSGEDYVGRPAGWGREQGDAYVAKHYHKVSDEIRPEWDLSGAVEEIRLLLRVGLDIASADAWPQWKEGSEFKARRDAMLKQE
ncbi:MAG: M28 family metallopeptidase [Nevskiaceae bacterium]